MSRGGSAARTTHLVERRRAVALARHFREAERFSIGQIGDRLGRSPATIKAYFYDDATGGKAKTVKARYQGRSWVRVPALTYRQPRQTGRVVSRGGPRLADRGRLVVWHDHRAHARLPLRRANGEPLPVAALGPIGGPGLRVLFVGINPSLRSAEVGHHFARPGNRFWTALHGAGFTPRVLAPQEDGLLPAFGLGVTNFVSRATRAAAELSADELRAGAAALEATVWAWQPRLVAVVGVVAYRVAFRRPEADVGLQRERVGGRPIWVLPNPSGLNAHYKPADFARLYAEARRYAMSLE